MQIVYAFAPAGAAAIFLPCGLNAGGLPIGLQVEGRAGYEETVLKLAHD